MQGKAKTILKGRLRKINHFGNGNNIRSEEVRTLDSDARGRSIMNSEGFSIRGLNPTRVQGLRVPHGGPQIFGAVGIPNLANLLLVFAWLRKIIYWKDLDNHNSRDTWSAASLPRHRLLGRPSLYAQTYRSTHDYATERENKQSNERGGTPNPTLPNNLKFRTRKRKQAKKKEGALN